MSGRRYSGGVFQGGRYQRISEDSEGAFSVISHGFLLIENGMFSMILCAKRSRFTVTVDSRKNAHDSPTD